jgi:hypothetical protein
MITDPPGCFIAFAVQVLLPVRPACVLDGRKAPQPGGIRATGSPAWVQIPTCFIVNGPEYSAVEPGAVSVTLAVNSHSPREPEYPMT